MLVHGWHVNGSSSSAQSELLRRSRIDGDREKQNLGQKQCSIRDWTWMQERIIQREERMQYASHLSCKPNVDPFPSSISNRVQKRRKSPDNLRMIKMDSWWVTQGWRYPRRGCYESDIEDSVASFLCNRLDHLRETTQWIGTTPLLPLASSVSALLHIMVFSSRR